jgi:hypothetical protein
MLAPILLQIWSARFVSQEGGVRMGAGIGGEDEVGRSESAPPRRVDMTRSGSSLGIGNNAQLYLPPGPRGNVQCDLDDAFDYSGHFALHTAGSTTNVSNMNVAQG